jgi:pilus assembly protein Flp/PilA
MRPTFDGKPFAVCYDKTKDTCQRRGKAMLELVRRLVREEEGQGMAEYGLILALIAVVVIAVLAALGNKLKAKFEEVNNAM